MINSGKYDVKILSDGWTAVTRDKSLSAQFEHSIGVTQMDTKFLQILPKVTHNQNTQFKNNFFNYFFKFSLIVFLEILKFL